MLQEVARRMKPEEIRELAQLRFEKSLTKLATALDVSYGAVRAWVDGNRELKGPASILMRQWLDEARAATAANGKPAPTAPKKLAAAAKS